MKLPIEMMIFFQDRIAQAISNHAPHSESQTKEFRNIIAEIIDETAISMLKQEASRLSQFDHTSRCQSQHLQDMEQEYNRIFTRKERRKCHMDASKR